MKWMNIKHITISIFISVLLLLAIDFLAGGYMLPCAKRTNLTFSRCFREARTPHPIYHHDLSKNFTGSEVWGSAKYSLCTDINGFKHSCNSNDKSSESFDIAFIGDSFTEGIGLEYEDTFVGQISAELPDLKIANLGVSSYSPSIYFSKIKFLLEQGINFKEVIVYIDISDIQDEATEYRLSNDIVVSKRLPDKDNKFISRMKQIAIWAFPLSYNGYHVIKERLSTVKAVAKDQDISTNYLMFDYQRSAWTYNLSTKGYGPGGVEGGIQQSISAMTKLSELLKIKGIRLSVGVYPWPAQILYDNSDSEQVRIWRNFCKDRCFRFYDSFDTFFSLKKKMTNAEVIERFFIAGDVHHNRLGAEVIAFDFIKLYHN